MIKAAEIEAVRLRRRRLLAGIGALAIGRPDSLSARQITLAAAEIELAGDWHGSLPRSVMAVVTRMRGVCLAGVPLRSDQQPTRLRVESRSPGGPAIWLHRTSPTLAWIIVNVGQQDWCKLAYQFGHELGHVFANSWASNAAPASPCQWVEEALVEAFSIRGLGLLADSWERSPPFSGDYAFAVSIRQYRADVLQRYVDVGVSEGATADRRGWFTTHRTELEQRGGISERARVVVPAFLSMLETDPNRVADLGALNRWPGRTKLDLPAYLSAWSRSCAEIGCEGKLAEQVRQWLLPE